MKRHGVNHWLIVELVSLLPAGQCELELATFTKTKFLAEKQTASQSK